MRAVKSLTPSARFLRPVSVIAGQLVEKLDVISNHIALDLPRKAEVDGVESGEMLDTFSHISQSGVSDLGTAMREVRHDMKSHSIRLTCQS